MAKRKARIPDTIGEIVAPGDVRDLIARFQADFQSETVGMVLVFVDTAGVVGVDACGLSDVQCLGAMELAKDIILHGSDE